MKALTRQTVIADPPLARFLFADTRFALVWLLVRVYVGYAWLDAGWHKITDPAGGWIVSGESLRKFWVQAAGIPALPANPSITYDWYRAFLQFLLDNDAHTWFGKVIAFGETAIGAALILGAFVGIAAAAGAFMNLNFMLAGSASINPVLLILAILLILAWKTAGHYGADRFLLPLLGTPWRAPRAIAAKRRPTGAPSVA